MGMVYPIFDVGTSPPEVYDHHCKTSCLEGSIVVFSIENQAYSG